MTRRNWIAHALSVFLAAGIACGYAEANDSWPTKPVKLIVPFPPGGTTDIVARLVANKLTVALGQPVVIDNRGGAGGSLGTDVIAKATDGHTIGMGTVSTLAINPVVFSKLPYDAAKDLVPVTNIAAVPNVMSINGGVRAGSMQEFVALARSQPGKLAYGSAGPGSVSHLMGEVFKTSSRIDLLHVPYKGVAPALNDTIGGQVQVLFDNLPSSLPHIQSGRLRALAVAAPRRLDALPSVPTFAELGMPEVNDMSWFGLIAPAGTSETVIKRLQVEVAKLLSMPDVRDRLASVGATPVGNTPAEFAVQISTLLEKNRKIARVANIGVE